MLLGYFRYFLKLIWCEQVSYGPMAETYAGAVQGLLSWFKSRLGLQRPTIFLSE